ncbi:hypothetical protein PIB30_078692 [Stylosanthes scabra]|uniref:Uncharacterized protein n=1 Tax=Stylosanthes scabra TaxID=79078 RepID=A0ABU6RR80_9FABA|nr:hypothetical protein [Stylosanthes scabra]
MEAMLGFAIWGKWDYGKKGLEPMWCLFLFFLQGQNNVAKSPYCELAGSRFGPTARFLAGSLVFERFADFRFRSLNRAEKGAGSRFDRFDWPVRSGFQNLG